MLEIESIENFSPASSAGFRRTDVILSCNGRSMEDWIDFFFSAGGLFAEIEYRRFPVTRVIRLRRLPGESWGFRFKGQSPSICRKKCVFCFVDQNHPEARRSLLVKDDDVRYSFLQGTYVTLENGDADFAAERGLSPLHVSVHCSDPGIRGELLGLPYPVPILDKLRRLSRSGISVETQIVVVPGMNDGIILEETLQDLMEIRGVTAAGVVPVGLTDHRQGLPQLRRPSTEEAEDVINICDSIRTGAMISRGYGWAYPSDELFIMAKRDIPSGSYYEGSNLQQNGIGMLARLRELRGETFTGRGLVCTGSLAAPFLKDILRDSRYRVLPVKNRYLGGGTGAAGLLAGRDVAAAVNGFFESYNRVILPAVMFNYRGVTIDEMTRRDIESSISAEVVVLDSLKELVE